MGMLALGAAAGAKEASLADLPLTSAVRPGS